MRGIIQLVLILMQVLYIRALLLLCFFFRNAHTLRVQRVLFFQRGKG